jgi:catechol 2,3-dioxygenase-like lactoylglutathione lyase family enzyme
MPTNKVVPELQCTDIQESKAFYTKVLGFSVLYERPAETFAYLSLAGADFMLEQVNGPGRRWITGELNKPFGRGVSFQIEVERVATLYAQVLEMSPSSIFLPLEDKDYLCGNETSTNRQFIAQDPDGYLLRFAEFRSPYG